MTIIIEYTNNKINFKSCKGENPGMTKFCFWNIDTIILLLPKS